eukprot:PhF_6_TR42380/c0_g1_i1/m.63933
MGVTLTPSSNPVAIVFDEFSGLPQFIRGLCSDTDLHRISIRRRLKLDENVPIHLVVIGTGVDYFQNAPGSVPSTYSLTRLEPFPKISKYMKSYDVPTPWISYIIKERSHVASMTKDALGNTRVLAAFVKILNELLGKNTTLPPNDTFLKAALIHAVTKYKALNGLKDMSADEATQTVLRAVSISIMSCHHRIIPPTVIPREELKKLIIWYGVLVDTMVKGKMSTEFYDPVELEDNETGEKETG